MKLKRVVTRDNFYKEYYTALNGVLKLSKLELEILAQLSIYKNKGEDILNKAIRKEIASKLSITTFNLNNYIGILKDKKMILLSKNNIADINPSVYREIPEDKYLIEFEIYVR